MIPDEVLDEMYGRAMRDMYGAMGTDVLDLVLVVRKMKMLLGSHADGSQCTCTMLTGQTPWAPAEWEQDPWCPTHPNMTYVLQETERLREHSVTLNTVSYRIAEALGKVVRPEPVDSDVEEDLTELLAKFEARDITIGKARNLVVAWRQFPHLIDPERVNALADIIEEGE